MNVASSGTDVKTKVNAELGIQIAIRLMEDEDNPEDAMVDAATWIADTLHALDFDQTDIRKYRSDNKQW